jgi:hypothetical protein
MKFNYRKHVREDLSSQVSLSLSLSQSFFPFNLWKRPSSSEAERIQLFKKGNEKEGES